MLDTNLNIHLEKKNHNLKSLYVQNVEDNILHNNNNGASDKCLNPGSSPAFISLHPHPTSCDK